MNSFEIGDRVRIDIPDQIDPDHDRYHGEHGTIIEILEDDADTMTDDDREGVIYRVELDAGTTVDFRWRDLRSPIR